MISINRKAVRASGGTQSDELKAKIKSVTSSTTVGAVFVYDTSQQDSDGGAWRKKTQGLSWYDEAASATRSARSEFPSMALIVADNVSNAATVSIYDLDDPAMPLWMKINAGSNSLIGASSATYSSVTMLNGVMVLGRATNGIYILNFANEVAEFLNNSGGKYVYDGGFVNRNGSASYRQLGTSFGQIAHDTVNDVAATVLEGAEIGALGLPIPTIAVATANKISVIHPSGIVADLSDSSSTRVFKNVAWRDDGSVVGYNSSNGAYQSFRIGSIHADTNTNDYRYENGSTTNIPNPITNADSTAIAYGNGKLYGGNSGGLTIFNENKGNPAESLFAYVTSTYNTGYMLGDIRLALAAIKNSTVTAYDETGNFGDRSVKGNTLTTTGTITCTPVATGAEAYGISGFSASNYLSRANDADFDFGTGDFSIMFWVKKSTISGSQNWISRGDSSEESGDWLIQMQTDGSIDFYRHSGSSWSNQISTSTGAVVVNSWTQVVLLRRGTRYEFWVNGKLEGSASNSNSYTPSGGSALTIGHSLGQTTNPADNSSLSLVRISATSPTPQQVKEIYEAEKPLFKAGAKCLLQSDSGTPNIVNDLSYDKSTNLLTVSQLANAAGDGASIFRGLEVVDTFKGDSNSSWSGNSISFSTSAGGVNAHARNYGTGGVIVDLPAIDVRAELNGSESKLPDDGKFHFSGVTTDATPTVIGNIPIGENESLNIKARFTGYTYNLPSSSKHIVGEIKQQLYRNLGSNVSEASEQSKLIEEGNASLDVDLGVVAASQTGKLTVTGYAGVRMVWTASVEVQRITEKTYER